MQPEKAFPTRPADPNNPWDRLWESVNLNHSHVSTRSYADPSIRGGWRNAAMNDRRAAAWTQMGRARGGVGNVHGQSALPRRDVYRDLRGLLQRLRVTAVAGQWVFHRGPSARFTV